MVNTSLNSSSFCSKMSRTTCFEVKTSSSGVHISTYKRLKTCSIIELSKHMNGACALPLTFGNVYTWRWSFYLEKFSERHFTTKTGTVWRGNYHFAILKVPWLIIMSFKYSYKLHKLNTKQSSCIQNFLYYTI